MRRAIYVWVVQTDRASGDWQEWGRYATRREAARVAARLREHGHRVRVQKG